MKPMRRETTMASGTRTAAWRRAGRDALAAAFVLALARTIGAIGTAPLEAAPPQVQYEVSATADADADRILVRWNRVGGITPYTHYDVLRRLASVTASTPINGAPIGKATTVASIEAAFNAPGRSDALGWITASFGADYAGDILNILTTGSEPESTLLPDQNYVAALVMGLGWLDETVAANQTYVYEVWGLDAQGFRVERLGQATATARQPVLVPAPQGVVCSHVAGQEGDRAAFLRWSDSPQAGPFFGYDVLRAPFTGGACLANLTSAPGAVRVNEFPVLSDSPGAGREGKSLFEAHCSSCHRTSQDPRLVSPTPANCSNCGSPGCNNCGVSGGSLELYRVHQNSEVTGLSSYPHATTSLKALSADALEAIFDYIEEFQFEDDAETTPGGPLPNGQLYCYQVVPRDLLGQYGEVASGAVTRCQIQDRIPPSVPTLLRSDRFEPQAGVESCRLSWDRNTDDTASYEIFRVASAVPRNAHPPNPVFGPLAQPASGARVAWDATPAHTLADAGRTFFYSVRAVDTAGNRSGLSGWVPCMPRDLVPPAAPSAAFGCCDVGVPEEECADRRLDLEWIETGGIAAIMAVPGSCAARLTCPPGGDTFACRVYRSLDGSNYYPGQDVPAGQAVDLAFQPLIDTEIHFQVKASDPSGNLSPPSTDVTVIYEGKNPLPAPRIISVTLLDAVTGEIRIRFRSLAPDKILGFALYRQYAGPDDPDPPAPVHPDDFVARFPKPGAAPPLTLSADPIAPGKWKVLANAVSLASRLDQVTDSTPKLTYDPVEKTYEMTVVAGKTDDIVLRLAVVGWSGKESATIPFRWAGFDTGDLTLEWPEWPRKNKLELPGTATLNVTPQPALGRTGVSWTPYPDGCNDGELRPFIVFRRRGSSPHWQQISPPFFCVSGTNLDYHDTDVENGFYYSYVVVRLSAAGEFKHQFGPTPPLCYGTCTGPSPQW